MKLELIFLFHILGSIGGVESGSSNNCSNVTVTVTTWATDLSNNRSSQQVDDLLLQARHELEMPDLPEAWTYRIIYVIDIHVEWCGEVVYRPHWHWSSGDLEPRQAPRGGRGDLRWSLYRGSWRLPQFGTVRLGFWRVNGKSGRPGLFTRKGEPVDYSLDGAVGPMGAPGPGPLQAQVLCPWGSLDSADYHTCRYPSAIRDASCSQNRDWMEPLKALQVKSASAWRESPGLCARGLADGIGDPGLCGTHAFAFVVLAMTLQLPRTKDSRSPGL